MEQIEWLQEEGQKWGIPVSGRMLEQFEFYRAMLLEENGKYNLISEKDEPVIVTRHFLQSIGLLAMCRFPPGCRVADLGSGAGFPGLPMKIVRPDMHMVLVESIGKKARFLDTVIKKLELKNTQSLCERMENIRSSLKPFDVVVSRAVADMEKLFLWSRHSMKKPGGRLIAIKGGKAGEEAAAMRASRAFRPGSFSVAVEPFNPFPDRAALSESHTVTVTCL